jgi:multidrug resistance efflux pump
MKLKGDLKELHAAADASGLSPEFWALIDRLETAQALRKDAERYQWLRRRQVECAPHVAIAETAAAKFDAAIDAAMGENP